MSTNSFLISVRLLGLLTALTGVLYPISVWVVARSVFPHEAGGSLLRREGKVVGSALLAQQTQRDEYFWPRPSAGDYTTVPSAASQLSWTSAKLAARLDAAGSAPADLVTTSASGLDPHLSLPAVEAQFERVATARAWTPSQRKWVRDWIAAHEEGGTLGAAYVNVLELNLGLDRATLAP